MMAPDQGFEPRPPESESGVLPLHQSGMVVPAGFEPGITGLKILCPGQLDEGTMTARLTGRIKFYAITRI